jgi:hypothetical protein
MRSHTHRLQKTHRTFRARFMAGGLAAAAAFMIADAAEAQAPNRGGITPEEPATGASEVRPANPAVYRAAMAQRGLRILVSTNERRLMLLSGQDTLMDVPVAVGIGEDFEYEGRNFRFETPTGRHRVLAKSPNPIWTPPDWHYMEKAAKYGRELVRLSKDDKIELADGSFLVVIGDQVGRINQFGNFWAFTPERRSCSTERFSYLRSARRSARSPTRSARTSWTSATAT